MAQRVTVVLEDDLDGTEASETVRFGLDGVEYEIDLNEENASLLRQGFASWVGAARRVGGRKQQHRSRATRDDLTEIREWARSHGYEVSDRGRVANDILRAYDEANR